MTPGDDRPATLGDDRPATPGEDLPDALRELLDGFRAGQRRALARAISVVEDERAGFEALLDSLHGEVGGARRIGVTGPPGAGKSTLVAGLARTWSAGGERVGVLAVDPTSPFTGGALLGDRIRMGELPRDAGIFIRSMASRGSAGGLATSTREAADLLDAFGFDRVLLETVGVGQSELDIASSADSTVVVLVPESGDGVQAMKAGLMEIADVFVVNKADRSGAERLQKELRVMLRLRGGGAPGPRFGSHGHHGASGGGPREGGRDRGGRDRGADAGEEWEIPVVRCVATEGRGVEAVADALERHWRHMETTGELEERRHDQRLDQARSALVRRSVRSARELFEEQREEVEGMLSSGLSPYRVAEALASGMDPGGDVGGAEAGRIG